MSATPQTERYITLMIQAIVYDAVGTLIHVQPSVATIYGEIGQRFGSKLDAGAIQRRFAHAFARQDRIDADANWRTDEARERRRWQDIVAEVLDDVADPAACFASLFDAFGKSDAWAIDRDAEATLTRVHQAGIRQALASNFDRRLHGIIANPPIARFLEQVVISSEVGWRKPAPQFFAHLAATLGLPPGDILFVGDDRGNDFDGARNAGMNARLLDPKRRHLDIGDRIDRLGELHGVGAATSER